jgi:hypothetical protein
MVSRDDLRATITQSTRAAAGTPRPLAAAAVPSQPRCTRKVESCGPGGICQCRQAALSSSRVATKSLKRPCQWDPPRRFALAPRRASARLPGMGPGWGYWHRLQVAAGRGVPPRRRAGPPATGRARQYPGHLGPTRSLALAIMMLMRTLRLLAANSSTVASILAHCCTGERVTVHAGAHSQAPWHVHAATHFDSESE